MSQNLSSRSTEFFLYIFEAALKGYVFWSIVNKSGRVDILPAFPTPLLNPRIFVPILSWNKTSSFLYWSICNHIFNCVFLVNKNLVEFCKSHVFGDSPFAREGDNLVVSHNVLKYLGYIISEGKKDQVVPEIGIRNLPLSVSLVWRWAKFELAESMDGSC